MDKVNLWSAIWAATPKGSTLITSYDLEGLFCANLEYHVGLSFRGRPYGTC